MVISSPRPSRRRQAKDGKATILAMRACHYCSGDNLRRCYCHRDAGAAESESIISPFVPRARAKSFDLSLAQLCVAPAAAAVRLKFFRQFPHNCDFNWKFSTTCVRVMSLRFSAAVAQWALFSADGISILLPIVTLIERAFCANAESHYVARRKYWISHYSC